MVLISPRSDPQRGALRTVTNVGSRMGRTPAMLLDGQCGGGRARRVVLMPLGYYPADDGPSGDGD